MPSLTTGTNNCSRVTHISGMGREWPGAVRAHHGGDGVGQLHGLELGHAEGGRARHARAHHLRVLLQQRLQVPARQRLRT